MSVLPSGPPRVLVPLIEGFEEIETVTPVDLLRRAGAHVIMASVSGEPWVTGRCQINLQADARLADVIDSPFDLVIIPGGPGVKALRADARITRLLRDQVEAGRAVAAICAGPAVLADAGVLNGVPFTAHFSIHPEFPLALAGERVVEDGLVITSRGAGTAMDFGLALVRRLFGSRAADDIAQAVMWPS